MRAMIGAVLLPAALAACQPSRAPEPPPPVPGDARPATAVQSIEGHATYLERIKMPPGARLTVDLLDAGQPIASVTVHDVGGPPIPFRIDVPRSAAASLAVRAALLGPDGERWLETPAPVTAKPGLAMELVLRRVATGPPRDDAPAAEPIVHWECGELGLMSRSGAPGTPLELWFNGRRLELPPRPSGSGTRYVDARGNEFQAKGGTGRLVLAGEAPRDCVRAAQPSPWNDAAARGVVFRAVGNEPGWFAEISAAPPTLHAVLDYGEREVRTPVRAARDGYVGTEAGAPVSVRLRREPCTDGMSGQAFEASVVLESAGRSYRGCGAWLQD